MKTKSLIILGFLTSILGFKSFAQSNLIDISPKTEEGFHDQVFNITDKQLVNGNWIITARGQYKKTIVGFKISIKNGINPGIVNGKPDQSGMIKGAGAIICDGSASDNFIRIISELYGFKSNKKFTKKNIPFDCFSLNEQQGFLDNGDFKFKLFLDSQNLLGLYSEAFLIIDFSTGLIEFNEKDPGYRENIVSILTR